MKALYKYNRCATRWRGSRASRRLRRTRSTAATAFFITQHGLCVAGDADPEMCCNRAGSAERTRRGASADYGPAETSSPRRGKPRKWRSAYRFSSSAKATPRGTDGVYASEPVAWLEILGHSSPVPDAVTRDSSTAASVAYGRGGRLYTMAGGESPTRIKFLKHGRGETPE